MMNHTLKWMVVPYRENVNTNNYVKDDLNNIINNKNMDEYSKVKEINQILSKNIDSSHTVIPSLNKTPPPPPPPSHQLNNSIYNENKINVDHAEHDDDDEYYYNDDKASINKKKIINYTSYPPSSIRSLFKTPMTHFKNAFIKNKYKRITNSSLLTDDDENDNDNHNYEDDKDILHLQNEFNNKLNIEQKPNHKPILKPSSFFFKNDNQYNNKKSVHIDEAGENEDEASDYDRIKDIKKRQKNKQRMRSDLSPMINNSLTQENIKSGEYRIRTRNIHKLNKVKNEKKKKSSNNTEANSSDREIKNWVPFK